MIKAAAAGRGQAGLALLLPFVLVSFAANSLITRYVAAAGLIDAGLLGAVRFVSGAAALFVICAVRRERPVVGRTNLLPALFLGVYAITISYGYRFIGAAAGTFVFYASVLVSLVGLDLRTRTGVVSRRLVGAGIALTGILLLALGSGGRVSVTGVVLLTVTGIAWGLYTAAGRTSANPRIATTGHFVVLAAMLFVPGLVGVGFGLRVSVTGLIWAVAMGIFTTALAYVAWYACQRSLSATTAGTIQLVIPVLTTIGAVLLLHERLTATVLVAALLVGTGLWLGRPRRT